VRLRFHLTALSREDMKAYVLHRLEVAGSNGRTIFAEDTFPLIYQYTGGVPRLVNVLCETAMMAAFTSDRDQVLPEDVSSAIKELQWPEFAARSSIRSNPDAARDAATTSRYNIEASSIRRGPELYIGSGDTSPNEILPDHAYAKLVIVTEGKTVGELPLRMGRTVVGRTPDNDLQIDSRFVSRHHCQVITKVNACIVEDLNSTNGIVVKSKRVRRHNLNDGDVITIGKHDLIYVDERNLRTGHTGKHATSTTEAASDDEGHGETQVI
jgi:pSer/pThr/pTyr-binding forkhead associated (FHA) protein